MTKVTRKEYFEILKGYAENVGDVGAMEFCDKELEKIANRKTTQTKAQKVNLELAEKAYEVLVALDKPATLAEIQEGDEAFATFTNQKMTALMKKLVDAGRVERTKEKKVTYYTIVEGV